MRTLLLALAITLLGAPARSQVRPAAPPPAHQRTTDAAQPVKRLTDVEIEKAIKVKLAKSKIGADKFQFHVQGGVATIEGRTDVIQHKGAATRMAKTAGAVAVVNHIQISEAAKQRAEANLAQGRRRAQIKRGDARSETASATPRSSTRAPAAPRVASTEKKTVGASGQNQ
jgi:BON domain